MKEFTSRGIRAGIFGDIDIEDHRKWEERVCGAAGLSASLPLWQADRAGLLDEFISAGFRAMIVTVEKKRMDESRLGHTLDADAFKELQKAGVDASGENGEYHTFVFDGPIFSRQVTFSEKGIIRSDSHASLIIDT